MLPADKTGRQKKTPSCGQNLCPEPFVIPDDIPGCYSYFGERNRRYINIETQHGKVGQYIKMFGQLLNVLAAEKKNPEEITGNPQ